ncbi:hypothetical protein BU14_0441s0010 [Porphyra umbilicalis]|uniref:Uncharacterized protein n=1 Tax=Porphyra umbilicalis TaxID=2786 RepID=A0A1X6NUW7_PORUM|nr:hypothetical protein BU14_0441s0010 [Porphyra umbilicalis]|eukprot:OSX72401.1 hypothetical protein BU14_0441s0010 [Porphyra umbilicalis]
MAVLAVRSVLVVSAAAVALVVALTAPVAGAPAGSPRCQTDADVGIVLGWCRCSAMSLPRLTVSPPAVGATDPWCTLTTPDTAVYYCDDAGDGGCDLFCVEPQHECTGPIVGANPMCKCAVGNVRTVLRYTGPFKGTGMA